MNKLARLITLAAVSATAAVSSHASTFAEINLDGNISDWSGIAASATNTGAGPLNQIFIANNDTHVFFLLTFNSSVNILTDGFRMNIDSDANVGTGFNTYGAGLVGSELLFEGETAYNQSAGNYANLGVPVDAPLLITNYTESVVSVELGISRSALSDVTNGILLFPGASFNLAIYFEGEGLGQNTLTGATYTFASIPEPSAFAWMAGLGSLGLAAVRRRR